jgi:hypothetical protein
MLTIEDNNEIKICPKCEVEKPVIEFSKCKSRKDGLCYMCKICNSTYHRSRYKDDPSAANTNSKRWRKNNPKRNRDIIKAWRKANPDKVRESKKQTYSKNIDNYRIYEENYRRTNRDKINAANKEWRKNHREKAIASSRAWQIANPDKVRIIKSRRRANKINQLHPDHDVEIEKQLINNARELELLYGIKYHVDHIWPLSKGGPHHHDNLQIISQSLNNQKKDYVDFTHPDIKSWMDLPTHLLKWIKLNKSEQFNGILEQLVKGGKYTQHDIDILIHC